jgi:DNA-binding CsgD family transcriptional regulator
VLPSDSHKVQYARALVELANVRHARGDTDGAHAAVEEARQLITTFADPGMLGSLLDRTERELGRPSRQRLSAAATLTDRELVVLRLLPTTLSQPEIAQELYVSVNTVRTHIQGIYRPGSRACLARSMTRQGSSLVCLRPECDHGASGGLQAATEQRS